MAAGLDQLVQRLEKVATRLEAVACKGGTGGAAQDFDDVFIEAYSKFMKECVDPFLALSAKIGGDANTQAVMLGECFKRQKEFLTIVAQFSAPGPADLPVLLKPTSDAIGKVTEFREKNRGSAHFNHLSAVSESIAALGWVTVAPKPGNFCKEMADAGQFYVNRVIKDFKEKDKTHVDWAKSLQKIFSSLLSYINDYHKTGCTWNSSAPKASAQSLSSSSAAAPPPPPGPPPPPPPVEVSKDADDATSRNALFAEINKGSDITKGLKKVTKDQMTHKNPALRNTTPVPYKAPTTKVSSAPRPFGTTSTPKKPPKFELEGKKWIIEYFDGKKDLVLSDVNMNQTLYVFRSDNCVIQVKGKLNSITLDGCKKTAVVFEDLVSTCEFINCQSIQAQANGKVPTVSIDKTDGCQVYLNKNCLDADIITAKSSEMNILIPNDDNDYNEYPIPEQFKTKWTGKQLKTEVNDIAG